SFRAPSSCQFLFSGVRLSFGGVAGWSCEVKIRKLL
ncbi:hypothetical protein LINPERHAP1_LOCUS13748, partial [Linum perenne]